MQKQFEFKVVGMTFLDELSYGAVYPDDFFRLQEIDAAAKLAALGWDGSAEDLEFSGVVEVLLYRNPENPYDANAIEVHVPSLGRRSMIGHVPRDLAARLAPSLDRGDKWDVRLGSVLVDPEHEDNPGALVVMECISIAK